MYYSRGFCSECRERYTRKVHNQKFCSERCYKINSKKLADKQKAKEESCPKKICEECGKEYKCRFCPQKFCTIQCRTIHQNKKSNETWLNRKEKKRKRRCLNTLMARDLFGKKPKLKNKFNGCRG